MKKIAILINLNDFRYEKYIVKQMWFAFHSQNQIITLPLAYIKLLTLEL